jgi:3-deoxy-manno-octulosonate cytidylyltransferase (CMP-KDO synthetase)
VNLALTVVIPARYASTRFPGKPLALLGGEPVIAHVARAALKAEGVARPVWVATDDERIAACARERFSPEEVGVALTSPDCASGTDRAAQVARERLGQEAQRQVIINVQGDEPFIDPAHIALLARVMREEPELRMATLAVPLREREEIENPNIVKVALSGRGFALYFSRAPIPFDRDGSGARYWRHLGIYAYESRWLEEMASLPPSLLEETEKLEQLRALEAGVPIRVATVESAIDIAIDTPQDLERAQAWWEAQES